jgi:Prolipoprotein diacylglyceryltransferase
MPYDFRTWARATANHVWRIGERPLIPCWSQPALRIGQFTLYAHGILLALGSVVGSVIFVNRAQTLCLRKRTAVIIILLLAPIGLLASHLTYSLLEDPSSLLELQGISSLGGILAGLLALALFTFRHPEPRWRWFDAAAYAGLWGALIARLGCFLAHDRIGLPTSSRFSVACFGGSYYDLALFEMVFLVAFLTILIWLELRHARLVPGVAFSALAVSYGTVRLILGQLSEPPQRYLGLAPEQWGGAILFVVGAFCWFRIKQTVKGESVLTRSS